MATVYHNVYQFSSKNFVNFVILLIFLIVYCWIMLPIGLSEAGRVFVRPINPKLEFHEVA